MYISPFCVSLLLALAVAHALPYLALPDTPGASVSRRRAAPLPGDANPVGSNNPHSKGNDGKFFNIRAHLDAIDAAIAKELVYERYGILAYFMLHPIAQSLKQVLEENFGTTRVFLGPPRIAGLQAIVLTVLSFLFRAQLGQKMGAKTFALLSAFLFNVNPLLVVVVCAFYCLACCISRLRFKHKPLHYVQPRNRIQNRAEGGGGGVVSYAEYQASRDLEVSFDHVIIGGEIGALYTAALLSRVGHTCCVVKPKGATPIEVTQEDQGPSFSCSIPTRNLTVGNVERIQLLLDMVQSSRSSEGNSRVAFAPVGTQDNGFLHTLLSFNDKQAAIIASHCADSPSGIWPLRVGDTSLGIDLWHQLLIEDKSEFSKYMRYLSKTQQQDVLAQFFSARFVPSSPLQQQQKQKQQQQQPSAAAATDRNDDSFLELATKSIEETLSSIDFLPDMSPVLRLILHAAAVSSMPDEISISPAECSSFALANAAALSDKGVFYPSGGCQAMEDALVRTIVSAGGAVLSDVPVHRILIQDEGHGRVAKGVVVKQTRHSNNQEQHILASRSVVSGMGIMHTYDKLVIKKDLPKGIVSMLPSALCESVPKILVLFWINASKDDANLSSYDVFQIGGASLNDTHALEDRQAPSSSSFSPSFPSRQRRTRSTAFTGGSMRIWSPSAKDPSWQSRHPETQAVVVELEAGEPIFSLQPTSSGSPRMYALRPLTTGEKTMAMSTALAFFKEKFPFAADKIQHSSVIGPTIADGQFISQSTAKYSASLSAASSSISGLFFCGRDMGTSGLAGEIQGGWVAANAVLGYTDKHFKAGRSIISDLQNV